MVLVVARFPQDLRAAKFDEYTLDLKVKLL